MKIETTFNIGDTVWVMKNNKVASGIVTTIALRIAKNVKGEPSVIILYTVNFTDDYHREGINFEYNERSLYRSKKELIESL